MKRGTRIRTTCLLLLVALCTSCRMFTPNRDNAAEGIVPDQFSKTRGRLDVHSRWWTTFNNRELDHLVTQALSGNLLLSQAEARLKQAEALAVQRGAAREPGISLEGSATASERENPIIPDGDRRTETYELGLAASYELDLWGRVSAVSRSAGLDRDASREDLRSAELTVAAEVTLRYLELMNTRAKLDLVNRQLKTNKEIEELMELRFRRSQASALDVLQQRGTVALIESLLPPLKAREDLLLNELAVFVGRPVGTDLGIKARKLPALPRIPGPGLPADLLARRPDVRASARRLESADWAVSAARADRLPALRLSASAGYSSDEVNELFENWITRLVGSLTGPVLDGGRRKAEVARTRALADERLAAYRATVLNAVREVEDALVLDRRQDELMTALNRQNATAKLSYNEAVSRYQKGMESYLLALVSLNNLQKTERELYDAAFNQAAYRVRLYRALAGSWKEGSSQ